MKQQIFPAFALDRLRMGIDGKGVTTLVLAYGCPLRCRYCINPRSWAQGTKVKKFTPETLLEEVRIDNLYFKATGGGITFGGGEPLMRIGFIEEFARICPDDWMINIETCLNVPEETAKRAAKVAHQLIVDIKDMNPDIYKSYTDADNALVKRNLELIRDIMGQENVRIRIPRIPDYNNEEDINASIAEIKQMGFTDLDVFNYKLKDKANS